MQHIIIPVHTTWPRPPGETNDVVVHGSGLPAGEIAYACHHLYTWLFRRLKIMFLLLHGSKLHTQVFWGHSVGCSNMAFSFVVLNATQWSFWNIYVQWLWLGVGGKCASWNPTQAHSLLSPSDNFVDGGYNPAAAYIIPACWLSLTLNTRHWNPVGQSETGCGAAALISLYCLCQPRPRSGGGTWFIFPPRASSAFLLSLTEQSPLSPSSDLWACLGLFSLFHGRELETKEVRRRCGVEESWGINGRQVRQPSSHSASQHPREEIEAGLALGRHHSPAAD